MPTPVSQRLYSAAECRELDEIAGTEFGLSGEVLMERAGARGLKALLDVWPTVKKIAVVCGAGNNGGDGFILARIASETGLHATVFLVEKPSSLGVGAARAYAKLNLSHASVANADTASFEDFELIVDAIFGTGLSRPLTGAHAELVRKINSVDKPVVSLDVPSGICATTGCVLSVAVMAELTVSFIGHKRGLFTADGPDHAGKIVLDDLGVPAIAHERVCHSAETIDFAAARQKLKPRPKNSHKGLYGHALVIGGAPGMTGAALIAGDAALRSGSGLVSLALPDPQAILIAEKRPELMVRDATSLKTLGEEIEKANVIAIGPGLSTSAWAVAALRAALAAEKPLIIDADALNLLALAPLKRHDWILTPHPGEAARLLGKGTKDVQSDRFAAATALQSRYGGVIILKGCGTLVCHDAKCPVAVLTEGNPGMAAGGMGDALTGVLAALVAQKLSLKDAAFLGVAVHARAGDLAAGSAPRGLLPTDLSRLLREVLNF